MLFWNSQRQRGGEDGVGVELQKGRKWGGVPEGGVHQDALSAALKLNRH